MLLVSLAFADILIEPDPGTVHVTHSVRIEGIGPEQVVVAWDGADGADIHTHRAFTAASPEQVMGRGGGRGSSVGGGFHLMSAEAYAAWNEGTRSLIMEQETACAERGEGCVHISRFEPTYPAPSEGLTACTVDFSLALSAPVGSPEQRVDVYTLQASEGACTLAGAPQPEGGKGATKGAAKGAAGDADSADCSTAPRWSAALGLLLLGLAVRRR